MVDQAAVVARESSGPPCFDRSRGRNELIEEAIFFVRLAETNRAACRQTNRQTGSVKIFVRFVDQAAVVAGRQTDSQKTSIMSDIKKDRRTSLPSSLPLIN